MWVGEIGGGGDPGSPWEELTLKLKSTTLWQSGKNSEVLAVPQQTNIHTLLRLALFKCDLIMLMFSTPRNEGRLLGSR